MPSSPSSGSQPKRPSMLARTSSASSAATLSALSPGLEGGPSSRQQQRKPRKHVAGHGRLGQRNTSFGKNLDKLAKLTAAETAKHHRRSLSGDKTTPDSPNAPNRPSMKRNASHIGPTRQKDQAPIRKNHSSGTLSRPSSSKSMLKPVKSEVAAPKRSLMKPGKSRQNSREDKHPTVHFDMGDDEEDDDPDDEWTEESASQSPHTTRSNTRSNSVILDPQGASKTAEQAAQATQATQSETTTTTTQRSQTQLPIRTSSTALSRATTDAHTINGDSSYQPSKPPDADIITSRLLRRTASHNLPPQITSVSATATPDPHDPRTLSHSQGSTLGETPGRDLVSRFMDGDGSAGTPRDSNFLPARGVDSPARQCSSTIAGGGDLDASKRNRSVPNMAAHSKTASTDSSHVMTSTNQRRSGVQTPGGSSALPDLPPSRTQQKLYLQRASSAIEPQKLIPVILPRTGAPHTFLTSGSVVNFSSAEGGGAGGGKGRIDPRLRGLFEQVGREWSVVRRYQSPVGDAVGRLEKIRGGPINGKGKGKSPLSRSTNSTPGTKSRPQSSRSQSQSQLQTQGQGRGSAEIDREEEDGRQSWESERERERGPRSEAEEICRRLWESMEVGEGEE